MKLENTFEVPASPAATWELLNDVPGVIPCFPGAELTEIVGPDTFKVTMHVKLGAIGLRFAADVEREVVDRDGWQTTMLASARELKGRGSATAAISSALQPTASGTKVTLTTDLQMKGMLMSTGRGLVGDVANQLVRQFADCLADRLREDDVSDRSQTSTAGDEVRPAPSDRPVAVGGLRLVLRALMQRVRQIVSRN